MKNFKKILPVAVGLCLIILIGVVILVVNVATNRTPKLSNGDDAYLSYGKLNVTKQDVYDALKKDYSVSEITRLIDTYLYQDEINKVTDDALVAYVEENIYGEDFEGDKQDAWDDVIDSLVLTGVISETESKSNTEYNNYTSVIWQRVKDYYRLPLAKENWAKARLLADQKELQAEKGWTDLFSADDIEDYFDENFGKTTTGLFIPFTSEKAALDMLAKYNVNTNQTSKGWVWNTFDPNKDEAPAVKDYLTPDEVINLFIEMYNEVLAYYTGSDIITSDLYETSYSPAKTLYQAELVLTEALNAYTTAKSNSIKGDLQLPLTIAIKDSTEVVKVEWKKIDTATLDIDPETGLLSVTRSSSSATTEVSVVISLGEEERELSYKFKVAGTTSSDSDKAEAQTVVVASADQVFDYKFNLTNDLANGNAQFIWEANDSSDFGAYLSSNSKEELTISSDAAEFMDSYTVEPVSIGNYYCLAIKFHETDELELENVKADVVAKMTEDLYSDNNFEKLYFENRADHEFKIYDKFIEAIYEYSYNTFYGTTLGLTDYDEFETSRKTKTKIVASVDGYEITPDELYAVLEAKYGPTYVKSFIDTYLLLNSDYNTYYNPWTGVEDEDYVKSLIKSDINSFKQNFELDYFTYSYLANYGFIPNFPASYGWKNFINDYFNVESEKDLLISKDFGGKIYSDVLKDYTKGLYTYEDLVKAMNDASSESYDVSVMNVVISVDYNYDGTPDTKIVESNKEDTTEENWTAEQASLVEELAKVMMTRIDEALAVGTLSEKLAEMVSIYDSCSYDASQDPWTAPLEEAFGKYKLAGLYVKFEAAANYTSSSSLVEEFHDAMYEIYNYASTNNLLYDKEAAKEDTKYENPIVQPINYNMVTGQYTFDTSYGFHLVAVEKANTIVEKPSEDEIALYNAANDLATAQSSLTSAKTNLENATGNKTAVASYKEQIAQLEKEVEEYTQQVKDLTSKLGLEGFAEDSDTYTIDEDVKSKCEYWYSSALTEVETYLVETKIINLIQQDLANMNFFNGFDSEQFNYYLNYLLESYESEE